MRRSRKEPEVANDDARGRGSTHENERRVIWRKALDLEKAREALLGGREAFPDHNPNGLVSIKSGLCRTKFFCGGLHDQGSPS